MTRHILSSETKARAAFREHQIPGFFSLTWASRGSGYLMPSQIMPQVRVIGQRSGSNPCRENHTGLFHHVVDSQIYKICCIRVLLARNKQIQNFGRTNMNIPNLISHMVCYTTNQRSSFGNWLEKGRNHLSITVYNQTNKEHNQPTSW